MKTNRGVRWLAFLAGICLAVLAWPGQSVADVIVLQDGSRLEGLATTSTLVPNVILFSDHVNKSLQIPRAKVQQIIHEPESAGRLRIARSLAREGKYDQALEQLREARRQAPDDPALQEEEQNVLKALAIHSAKKAEVKADESRGVLDKIKKALDAQEYEKALPLFAMAESESAPGDVREAAARLKIQFYDRWGDYRADKTDALGAIECYERVMDLDPNSKETYTKLMRLYERLVQPGADAARAQKLQEYLESRVSEDPKDLDSRLRLANLLYLRKDWDGALQQYLALYRDNTTSQSKDLPLERVQARLRALLEGRHRKSAERHEYDLAIQQFREMESIFPDVDTHPLTLYEYQKRAQNLGPQDDNARMELAQFCQKAGLDDYARKEVNTVLRNNSKNAQALKILTGWARDELAEIETAFNAGLFAQINGLVSQFHDKYPVDRYPNLQQMSDQADDYLEKARNELVSKARDNRQRATDLADAGDQNFERGMGALENYRNGSDVSYRNQSGNSRYGSRGTVTRSVGSYKADAIMYFERALRYYREAIALDPSLGDPAKKDLRRKIADCQRYLSMLKSQYIYRVPPGPRSSRRYLPPYPENQYYGGQYYNNPYSYPYGSPYIWPMQPNYWPYGVSPYPTPYYWPTPTPVPTPARPPSFGRP
jgi:tetratricopeptide (TPR) repeat protein